MMSQKPMINQTMSLGLDEPAGPVSLETNMLSFSRSLQISEGLFYGTKGIGADRSEQPVRVFDKGVRGQSSEDNAKNAGKSNPQVVESASVPQGCDAIELRFSVRVLAGAMKPHACDAPAVALAYSKLASSYAESGGFRRLAELYVWNLANGRFAWRNRWQADVASVVISFSGRKIEFNPFSGVFGDLRDPVGMDGIVGAITSGSPDDLEAMVSGFAVALGDPKAPFTFSVAWRAEMGPGAEVFPSQEYIRDDEKKDSISRVYAKLPGVHLGETVQQASMHSQKIGAALRHIDVWHGDYRYGAIAVNPYGGVQETSEVLRPVKGGLSFYSLRSKPAGLLAAVAPGANLPTGGVDFVMANLVRGGVFGSSKKPSAVGV